MNLDIKNLSKRNKIIALGVLLLAVVLLLAWITGAIIDANRINLIKNGEFNAWIFSTSGWKTYDYINDYEYYDSEAKIYRAKGAGIAGGDALCIENGLENDVRLYQKVKVKPNTYYKITASFKVDGQISGGNGAGISIYDQKINFHKTSTLDSNNEWVTYTVYGVTGNDQDSLELAVGLGGFGAVSKGKIWIDGVSMERIDQVPEGEEISNLYIDRSTNENLHVPLLKPAISRWIFRICVIATILFVFFLVIKADKKQKSREEEIAKGEWQPGMKLTKWKEVLLLIIMTMAYLLLALHNLGDTKAPETHFKPEHINRNEQIILAFDGSKTISRTMYHTVLSDLGDTTVAYKLEYLDANGEYQEFMQVKDSGFYKWHYADYEFTTNKIRITVVQPGLEISEFGFLSKNTAEGYTEFELVQPVEIEDVIANGSSESPSSKEQYWQWFDEPDTIVDTPSFMNSTYFDEIYHPRTAYEHLNGLKVYEITHPPLGKLIQSVGIAIFGMNPFGWRIMGTLAGVVMIPIMYLLAKKMFNSPFFAFMAAALMMFDTMHFAQTRLATIDSYGVIFIMLMYYYMYDVFICRSYEVKFSKYLFPLAMSGLFFGIGAASKWICIYAGFGLAILFFISKGLEIYNHKKLPEIRPEVKDQPWYKDYFYDNVRITFVICVLFFVLIPMIIYCLSYLPYVYASGAKGNLWQIVWSNQKYMYSYHSQLTAGHGYSSEWWQWILDLRPIWYYNGEVASGLRSTIASFGNPVIWWTGLVALFSSCYIAWKKKEKKIAFAVVGYACQLLPWMIVFRASFIYHYFSCLPFLILFIVYVAKHLYEIGAVKKWMLWVFLGVTALVFILFYPAISGMVVSEDYIVKLRIFPTWYF